MEITDDVAFWSTLGASWYVSHSIGNHLVRCWGCGNETAETFHGLDLEYPVCPACWAYRKWRRTYTGVRS